MTPVQYSIIQYSENVGQCWPHKQETDNRHKTDRERERNCTQWYKICN